MNKEKLIEEVRRYPYLYDASDAKYADSVKRDQTWKSIARTLSATGMYLSTYNLYYIKNVVIVFVYGWLVYFRSITLKL